MNGKIFEKRIIILRGCTLYATGWARSFDIFAKEYFDIRQKHNLKMVITCIKSLNRVASFLRVQAGKISINEDCLPTRVVNKNTISGYINIIFQLISEANSNFDGYYDNLEKAEIRQWIEYAILHAAQAEASSSTNQVLKELNGVLATRTYLVAHKLTVADIFLYYVLQNIMENLTILDKEKYVNVSRWFDNLQQNSSIRQSNKLIDFNTLYLASVAPARH